MSTYSIIKVWPDKKYSVKNNFWSFSSIILLSMPLCIQLFTFTMGQLKHAGNFITFILPIVVFLSYLGGLYILQRLLTDLIHTFLEAYIWREQHSIVDTYNPLTLSLLGKAHDFHNHLQVLWGYLNLKQYEQLTQYMGQLIEQVHTVENGVQTGNPVFDTLCTSKIQLAENSGIHIELNVHTQLNNLSVSDINLSRILGNVLNNAIEAVEQREKKEIKVEVTGDRNQCVLCINSSSYINRTDLQTIFKPGYSSKGKHRGLGLFTTKRLLQIAKGTIEIKSSIEEGTTVYIIIPRVAQNDLETISLPYSRNMQ